MLWKKEKTKGSELGDFGYKELVQFEESDQGSFNRQAHVNNDLVW